LHKHLKFMYNFASKDKKTYLKAKYGQ
jgi:hypothetical protein